MSDESAEAMIERAELALATMDVQNAQAHVQQTLVRMEYDTKRYGEWQCDYNEWMRESQANYDAKVAALEALLDKFKAARTRERAQ